MFNYELEIKMNSRTELPPVDPKDGEWTEEDTFQYKNLYYGFQVADTGCAPMSSKFDDRVFTMAGTSTLEELQEQFMSLTKEILASEVPPRYFKGAIDLLNTILVKQDEKDFDDNLEWEVSRQYPMFGVRLYLHKIPAPVKKDPEPDGCVTGSLWDVQVKIENPETKRYFSMCQETVFCIKPESAVHEVFDRLFRNYPEILNKYKIESVEVRKIKDKIKIPYIVIDEEKK